MPAEKVSIGLRRVVAARADGYCEYCRSPEGFATESFTVDHVIPRAADGENTLENLAWSCFGCNSFKHTKTQGTDLETEETVALYNPRQQGWEEHFGWSEDLREVVGKTACGRVTVAALRVNREGLMNLRGVLAKVGAASTELKALGDAPKPALRDIKGVGGCPQTPIEGRLLPSNSLQTGVLLIEHRAVALRLGVMPQNSYKSKFLKQRGDAADGGILICSV